MSQYTKGKWKTTMLGLGVVADDAETLVIADCTNMPNIVECKANAHLIAAAPDMYEALKLFIERARELNHKYPIELALPFVHAEQALSKAEGK